MQRPERSEYDPYYETYVSLVPGTDPLAILAGQPTQLQDIFTPVPDEEGLFAYSEGKWTLKQLLGHLIDAERMFAYRVFRISRGDETPIEGFEQEGYIENAHSNDRSFGDLLEEFNLLRRANLLMFEHFTETDWARVGTANNVRISTRALAFIMAGHITHHVNILHERYKL